MSDSLHTFAAVVADFLSWGFKDRPSVVRLGDGSRLLTFPQTPIVQEQPCSQILRSCRLNDFSGSRLPRSWPMDWPPTAPTLGFVPFS